MEWEGGERVKGKRKEEGVLQGRWLGTGPWAAMLHPGGRRCANI